MFSNAFCDTRSGTRPVAGEPDSTGSTIWTGRFAFRSSAAASAMSAGSSSMKVVTSAGSSAFPDSCFINPIAPSWLSALWYGRSVVTAS